MDSQVEGRQPRFPLQGQLCYSGPPSFSSLQAGLTRLDSDKWHPDEKTEGPCTCLTALGIAIDTLAMELRLPSKKLQRLCDLSARGGEDDWISAGISSPLQGYFNMPQRSATPGRTFCAAYTMYNLLVQTTHLKQ